MKTMLAIVWLMGTLILAGVGNPLWAAAEKDGPVIIGVLENAGYAFAPMMKRSFNMAMEKINARGGVNGRPVKLIVADDGGDPKKGVQAVRRLVKNDHAVMLVGGYSSSNTLVMAQAAERLDTPFLVCTAADDRITQRKKKNLFRLNPPAAEYTPKAWSHFYFNR